MERDNHEYKMSKFKISEKISESRSKISKILDNIKVLEDTDLRDLQTQIVNELERREMVREKQITSFNELMTAVKENCYKTYCYYKEDVNEQGVKCVSDMTQEFFEKIEQKFLFGDEGSEDNLFEYEGELWKASCKRTYIKERSGFERGRVQYEKITLSASLSISRVRTVKLSDEN